MKILTVTFFIGASALIVGCNSLDNPLANLFHGHDARVYNPQTGEWEWPNKKATPPPQKSATVAAALNSTPAPQASSRSTDWVQPRNAPSSPDPAPPASTPSPLASAAVADPAATAPPPTPPPPRPARATGYYNSSTGKIEWQTSGNITASATPPPRTATKHWWWPF